MSNELMKIETQSFGLMPSAHEMQVLQVIAKQAFDSAFYKSLGGLPQIMSILLTARELNIMPMQALNGGIWNIQGKVEISARLMSTLIRRAGHSIKVIKCDKTGCILEGKRLDNGDSMQASFTIEDAIAAGLAGRDVWKKYLEDMLYSRALSRLARRLYSDVIGNCYVEGEIRDATADCVVTDAPKEIEQESPAEVPEILPNEAEIESFIEDFGQDKETFLSYMAAVTKSGKVTREKFFKDFMLKKDEKMEKFNNWKDLKAQSAK